MFLLGLIQQQESGKANGEKYGNMIIVVTSVERKQTV